MELNKLRDEIHELAISKGWWDEERTFGEIIALCHSELSEALEEYRNGAAFSYYKCTKDYENCPRLVKPAVNRCNECENNKPEGIAIELADCIIRILDYCGKEGINIEEAIRIKHNFNKSLPYKHGGKRI